MPPLFGSSSTYRISPQFLAVDLEHQFLPESIERALHYLNPDSR